MLNGVSFPKIYVTNSKINKMTAQSERTWNLKCHAIYGFRILLAYSTMPFFSPEFLEL